MGITKKLLKIGEKMKNLSIDEVARISGGMCNCVGNGWRCGAEGPGGFFSAGAVEYPNDCKDLNLFHAACRVSFEGKFENRRFSSVN